VNASAGPAVDGNVPTTVALTLDGDIDHQDWDFETVLTLRLLADDGPARAATKCHGGPGTEIDFFGEKHSDDSSMLAGPFQHISSTASTLKRWPPPPTAEEKDEKPQPEQQ
jgi:hypothetical protein